MQLPGITHQFGPWSPMRFIPIPFRDGEEPAFWVTTSRICLGTHDWRCTQVETQTFGPLVLEGNGPGDLFRCSNCARIQPPVHTAATGEEPVCLFCTDAATVQQLHTTTDTTAAVAALAALNGASGTLRLAKEADPDGFLALLDETSEALLSLLDDAAWAVRQEPQRAAQAMYRGLALIARQILANARDYASLTTEPLPVTETEGD